jgi:hypothetical protein
MLEDNTEEVRDRPTGQNNEPAQSYPEIWMVWLYGIPLRVLVHLRPTSTSEFYVWGL